MIIPAQEIFRRCRDEKLVTPFTMRSKAFGMTFGVSPAGYDVRSSEGHTIAPGGFELGVTEELFTMPDDLMGIVHDKSTWARQGLALQNTVIEPGWTGYLTIEMSNHGYDIIRIERGMPIAQIVFHLLAAPTFIPYDGKYQHQPKVPIIARFEKEVPNAET